MAEGPTYSRDNCSHSNCVILNNYGGYDKLSVGIRDIPAPKPGQVLVNIKAGGMNFSDLYVRQGLFRGPDLPKPPFVMGKEAAGIIEQVGDKVENFVVGDRVACLSNKTGLWSDFACAEASDCILIPDSMDFDDAAAFYINYLTAYFAVFGFGNLKPNEKIFIHSLAGGVGWAATQLANTVPGVIVMGTASTSKFDVIKLNGVDFAIDSSQDTYVNDVLENYPQGVDVVLDNRSGADFHDERKMLHQMGKIVHLGANNALQGEHRNILQLIKTWWDLKNVSVVDLIMMNQAVCGFNLDVLKEKCRDRFNDAVNELNGLYTKGLIKPRIDSTWSFDEVSKATHHMVTRKNIGKIILKANK